MPRSGQNRKRKRGTRAGRHHRRRHDNSIAKPPQPPQKKRKSLQQLPSSQLPLHSRPLTFQAAFLTYDDFRSTLLRHLSARQLAQLTQCFTQARDPCREMVSRRVGIFHYLYYSKTSNKTIHHDDETKPQSSFKFDKNASADEMLDRAINSLRHDEVVLDDSIASHRFRPDNRWKRPTFSSVTMQCRIRVLADVDVDKACEELAFRPAHLFVFRGRMNDLTCDNELHLQRLFAAMPSHCRTLTCFGNAGFTRSTISSAPLGPYAVLNVDRAALDYDQPVVFGDGHREHGLEKGDYDLQASAAFALPQFAGMRIDYHRLGRRQWRETEWPPLCLEHIVGADDDEEAGPLRALIVLDPVTGLYCSSERREGRQMRRHLARSIDEAIYRDGRAPFAVAGGEILGATLTDGCRTSEKKVPRSPFSTAVEYEKDAILVSFRGKDVVASSRYFKDVLPQAIRLEMLRWRYELSDLFTPRRIDDEIDADVRRVHFAFVFQGVSRYGNAPVVWAFAKTFKEVPIIGSRVDSALGTWARTSDEAWLAEKNAYAGAEPLPRAYCQSTVPPGAHTRDKRVRRIRLSGLEHERTTVILIVSVKLTAEERLATDLYRPIRVDGATSAAANHNNQHEEQLDKLPWTPDEPNAAESSESEASSTDGDNGYDV